MVIMSCEMQKTMNHETCEFLFMRNSRTFGLLYRNGNTDIDFSLDSLLVVGKIERQDVGGTVFVAVVPVQFMDAVGFDQNDSNTAFPVRLFVEPQCLKCSAKGGPVRCYLRTDILERTCTRDRSTRRGLIVFVNGQLQFQESLI